MPSNTERSESSREARQPGMLPTSIHLVACLPAAECESEWKNGTRIVLDRRGGAESVLRARLAIGRHGDMIRTLPADFALHRRRRGRRLVPGGRTGRWDLPLDRQRPSDDRKSFDERPVPNVTVRRGPGLRPRPGSVRSGFAAPQSDSRSGGLPFSVVSVGPAASDACSRKNRVTSSPVSSNRRWPSSWMQVTRKASVPEG